MAKTYPEWHTVADNSGASGLAEITDATGPEDPFGTLSDRSYWEGHAYDVLKAILLELGSSPGSGVTGNFVVNNDNVTNNAEDSYLEFSRGTAQYGNAYIAWASANNRFSLDYDLAGGSLQLGTSSSRWSKLWSTDGDFSGNVDIGGTLDVVGQATVDDLDVTGTLSIATLAIDGDNLIINADATTPETVTITAYRGAADPTADIQWNETNTAWEFREPSGSWRELVGVGDSGVLTTTMFASSIYGGSGSNWGVAATIARSDHTHSGGTVGATGTDNETFTVDADWTATDDTDIELRFGSSAQFIRMNPDDEDAFLFSHALLPVGTLDLGETNSRWNDLWLGNDAWIAGDLSVTGDASLLANVTIGAIAENLDIKGTQLTLDSDAAADGTALIRVPLDGAGYAGLQFTGSAWQVSHDGGSFATVATLTGSETLTNKTLSAPILSGIATGDMQVSGTFVANADAASTSEDAYFEAGVSTGTKPAIFWAGSETGQPWRVKEISGTTYDIVLRTKQQTLTNKRLTSPTLSGGTWEDDPSFTGSPTFNANASDRVDFQVNVNGYAPFSVTGSGGVTPAKVTNLDADKLDGRHLSDTLYSTTAGQEYVAQRDIDLNGNTIIGLDMTPDAHQADHLSGGTDALAGGLGAVTGVTNATFRIDSAAGTTSTRMYLGSPSDFYMGIHAASVNKMIGMGGANVHLVPGNGTAQHLGYDSNRWAKLWISEQINFTPMTTAEPATSLENGSLWVVDGSSINDNSSALKVRLSGTTYRVISDTNKTGMIGSAGAWSVAGNITVTGTVDGRDVATDGTKLDGIEASADVTDATNVAAAGAVMTSTGFGGDVTGTYNATVVGNDSHTHSTTLSGNISQFTNNSGYFNTSNDGVGSGLDADMVDGYHIGSILLTSTGFGGDVTGAYNAIVVGNDSHYHTVSTLSGNISVFTNNSGYFNTSNDGAGSGLDADLLDGSHASAFATSGHGHSYLPLSGGTLTGGLAVDSAFQVNAPNIAQFYGGGAFWENISVASGKTVDGRDVSIDGSKLDGIETSADVTDVFNVAAAGAVMTTTGFGGDVSGTYDAIVVADDSHAHTSYLPLAGGTMAGSINFSGGGVGGLSGVSWLAVTSGYPGWDSFMWWETGTPQSLRISIGGERTIIDGNGKTGMVGSLGAWDVIGNITVSGTVDGVDIAGLSSTVATKVPLAGGTMTGDLDMNGAGISLDTNQKLSFDRATDHEYISSDGTWLTLYSNNTAALAMAGNSAYLYRHLHLSQNNKLYLDGSSMTDYIVSDSVTNTVQAYANSTLAFKYSDVYTAFTGNVYVAQDKKIYLDWDSQTYITFDGSSVRIFVNGTQQVAWTN
jgi:hypothetical protein